MAAAANSPGSALSQLSAASAALANQAFNPLGLPLPGLPGAHRRKYFDFFETCLTLIEQWLTLQLVETQPVKFALKSSRVTLL